MNPAKHDMEKTLAREPQNFVYSSSVTSFGFRSHIALTSFKSSHSSVVFFNCLCLGFSLILFFLPFLIGFSFICLPHCDLRWEKYHELANISTLILHSNIRRAVSEKQQLWQIKYEDFCRNHAYLCPLHHWDLLHQQEPPHPLLC